MCARDCVKRSSFFVLLCVWLCAQTCWLVADNNTRGRVFVDLLAEEIPTVLSVSGLCVFLGLHAWLCQLFYSPVGPLNPTQPLSPRPPLLPSEACSSSDKAALAKPLSRAPHSPSALLRANNTPSSPLHAHAIYMWKHWVLSPVHWSYGTTAKWVPVFIYVSAKVGRELHE